MHVFYNYITLNASSNDLHTSESNLFYESFQLTLRYNIVQSIVYTDYIQTRQTILGFATSLIADT